ncbi:fimbria/pilus outer membrane usher protein [Vibrio splendidus]|uniref:fimbria/pilus outer membrane usher protein n=1 Tax=Vibrio splendidus TaxID=29497 RepID=UPI00076A3E76|nr:fimbria/pilus outer membrane usher protein [Vibrio splendidus]
MFIFKTPEIRTWSKLFLPVLLLSSNVVHSQDDLDYSFLNTDGGNIPEVFKNPEGNVSGEYFADVFFNGKNLGLYRFKISNFEREELCLKKPWLKSTNAPIKYHEIDVLLDSKNDCYVLSKIDGGFSKFDYTTQRLILQLPQVLTLEEEDIEDNWDFGDDGFRLNYYLNGNKSFSKHGQKDYDDIHGVLDFNANVDRWVLSGKASGNQSRGIKSPDLTLSTAIQPIRGDFSIGKSFTRSSLIDNFSFYGIALNSNQLMKSSFSSGYAPIIEGTLNTNAKVTVVQGKYTLYSRNLPAGPFRLDNISTVSNGELILNIEEDNGSVTRRVYPVNILPNLLRSSEINYSFATGVREESSNIYGTFGMASMDYGFDLGTASLSSVIHSNYKSIGSSFTVPLGMLGVISSGFNLSKSSYDSPLLNPRGLTHQTGVSFSLKYAKYFGQDTNVQLLSYQYTGEGYEDFATFNPSTSFLYTEKSNRYEAIIEQNIGFAHLNLSAWAQEYRGISRRDAGINASFSKSFSGGISAGLNGSYSEVYNLGSQYSAGINVSVPLDIFSDKSGFLNSGVTHDSSSGSSFNAGLTLASEDNISHNVNVSTNKHGTSSSLYTGIRFDNLQTGWSISDSPNSTSLSASASGVIAGSRDLGVAYSSQQSDTLAIAQIKGIDNVTFNGSNPTNSWGNAIVPLTPYQVNNLKIDTKNIPNNIQLKESKHIFTPTGKSIVARKFSYMPVDRYLLRIFDKNGDTLRFGTKVESDTGVSVGFISDNGVLVASLASDSEYLKVNNKFGSCVLDISEIKPGTMKLEHVTCI